MHEIKLFTRLKRGVGNKSTFEKINFFGGSSSVKSSISTKNCVPIVKIGFLLLAGERAKVSENVNKNSV